MDIHFNPNEIMLKIERIDLAMVHFKETLSIIKSNDEDITNIEKHIINITNELRDIRKDVKYIEDKLHTKLISIEDNNNKLHKKLETVIEKIQSEKENNTLNLLNKNKLVTLLVSIISLLFISSNEKTQEILTKILAMIL
jgi:septal ring factor EnvC (AmiA/AmiB activator)